MATTKDSRAYLNLKALLTQTPYLPSLNPLFFLEGGHSKPMAHGEM